MSDLIFQKIVSERKEKNQFLTIDKKKLECFLEELFYILFTPSENLLKNKILFQKKYDRIKNDLYLILINMNLSKNFSKEILKNFLIDIPNIYDMLLIDADAILKSDPAATSIYEIFFSYPGFFATALYRLAHQLWNQQVPIIPRLITEYAHSKTGVDIHASAIIGTSFSIDHGTGVVIGSSTIIGDEVKIYQGVTLGAIYVDKKLFNKKRHPTIENKVTIYSGATILGGNTVIGHDSIIGGNVWITRSVPPFSVVYQKNEIAMKNKPSIPSSINFII
ncbi:serine O-acetyltransferase [Blattabacterium cuenoti]|uniref:serine O-acetyltransferase n=1 Tax=Blattabacterium cuenoti TaxID=1653831 RepID=UPI00163C7C5B|nr:serine acetyltransferase [Blattabacterium cuenoti]